MFNIAATIDILENEKAVNNAIDIFKNNLDNGIVDLNGINNKHVIVNAIAELIQCNNISTRDKNNNLAILKNMFITHSDNFWDAELWMRYFADNFSEREHHHILTSILNKHEYKYSVMATIIDHFHDDIIRKDLSLLFINNCDNSYTLAKWFTISGLNYDEIRYRVIQLNNIEPFIDGINTVRKSNQPKYTWKDFFKNLPDDYKLGVII